MLRAELHWDRVMNCYADRPADLCSHLADVMKRRSSAIAVVDGSDRISYGDLDRQSASLASLLDDRGVAPGDRVAVMLNNGVDAVRALLAVLRCGAVLVAIGTRSRGAELAHIFADAEPVAIIHGPEFASEIASAGNAPAVCLDVDDAGWGNAIKADRAFSMPVSAEEALFAILYTSGTTGRPKGAMLTHLGVIHSCLHWRDAFLLGESERTLFCVPWAHVSGLCGVLMPFLYLGGTLVMVRDFKRRRALELAAEERITHALMVPAMYGLMLLESDLAEFNLGSWRIAAYGGAPMPEPMIRRFGEAFSSLAMCNAYGATETTSPVTIMPPGEGTTHSDSIGRAVACGTIKVMDENGAEVPRGTDGELWIAGPMVVPGYWRAPEATARSFSGGFWRSGDIGSVDDEGFVRIADRKKDMIIRGGFKVYPAEVESVIAGIAGVAEAAVVGRPDAMLGEGVVAFVCAHTPDVTEHDVQAWCAARLSDYKVPGHVVVSREPLPRNVNGKLQKASLRETAAMLPQVERAA